MLGAFAGLVLAVAILSVANPSPPHRDTILAICIPVLAVFCAVLAPVLLRKPPCGEDVTKAISAIEADYPESVREWGGAWVLRKQALVAEILRIEEQREVSSSPAPSHPT